MEAGKRGACRLARAVSEKSALDRWLTVRYALFQDSERAINSFEIHHVEWPTAQLHLDEVAFDYRHFAGLLNQAPDRSHHSPGVEVIAWGKESREREG